MSSTGEVPMVRMDQGSASVVSNLVEAEVSCGATMDLQIESGPFDFLRYGLFCKLMFATARPDDDPAKTQCVAMGGEVKGCPFVVRGNSSEIQRKLTKLQGLTKTNLVYSPMGNFNSWQPKEE